MNALEVRTVIQALMLPLEKALERAAAPLVARIEALEARGLIEGPPGRDGIDGVDGKSVDLDAVEHMVKVHVATTIAALPLPERGPPGEAGLDGRDGQDGRDVDPEHVRQFVAEAVAALPPAERGEPGVPGKDGADVDPEHVLYGSLLRLWRGYRRLSLVPLARTAHPVGTALTPILTSLKAWWRRLWQRYLQHKPEKTESRVVMAGTASLDPRELLAAMVFDGKDGAPGANGRDGVSAEEMTATTPDYGRTIIISLARGGEVISQNVITTGLPIDRGVWKEGAYARGDGVSWGGEYWIARRDTKLRPVYGANGDWRLAVKKGRTARMVRRANRVNRDRKVSRAVT